MRSEGFVPSAVKDTDVAKTHNLMVLFRELPEEPSDEREKDNNDSWVVLRQVEEAFELWKADPEADQAFLEDLGEQLTEARRLIDAAMAADTNRSDEPRCSYTDVT
jgi:hypothetical protein